MTNKMKLISLLAAFAMVGCSLEVDNPNSLLEADLTTPAAASAVANGGWNATLNGIGYIMIANAVATDEVVWTGSRDAWRQLDKGGMTNVYNEFVDGAWPFITEGRWMSDKAVSVLEGLGADLEDNQDLVRAYLSASMVRLYIADMFDDFVMDSDKTVSGNPTGAANMKNLYDEATALLGKAAALADADNKVRIAGLKARVAHAKAVWGKVNPVDTSSPYVNAGATEAAAALALMDGDYKWKMIFSPSTVSNDMSWQINGRLEMDVLDSPKHPEKGGDPNPNDPVTGAPDTRILAEEVVFRTNWGGTDFAPITIVSAREMHLIIAESKKAGGDNAGCITELNKIRAMDGLDVYTTEDAGTALQHERRANLFLQGRRLPDMYRFGVTSVMWDAVEKSAAGSFFPIPIREIRANENITQ